MKYIGKSEKVHSVRFDSLSVGDTFKYLHGNDNAFMKIDSDTCVILTDLGRFNSGYLHNTYSSAEVVPIHVELRQVD